MAAYRELFRKGDQFAFKDPTTELLSPLVNGRIVFWDAGTNSAQEVFSNTGLSNSLGTNITLDADGKVIATVYIGTTAVKYEVRTSGGVPVFSAVDNIQGGEEENAAGFTKPEIIVNGLEENATISASDASEAFAVNAANAVRDITLNQSADYANGHPLIIFKNDVSDNVVNVISTNNETLNALGSTTEKIRYDNEGRLILPDGSKFHTLFLGRQRPEWGLQVTANGTNTYFDVSAGAWWSHDRSYYIQLDTALTKRLGNTWELGSVSGGSGGGALSAGTVAVNTTYHVFVIANPITHVSDVLLHTSLDPSGSLPPGYTKYRRIWSLRTNGSSQLPHWLNCGKYYCGFTSQQTISVNGSGEKTISLAVPSDIRVMADIQIACSGNGAVNIWPTGYSNNNSGMTYNTSPHFSAFSGNSFFGSRICNQITNTARQINTQLQGSFTLYVATMGYNDFELDL